MALFKILRGPSSELTKLPINDGWCYFTPDTGLFHIDYNGQRVPLNSKNALNASNATSAIMTEGIIDQNSGDVIKLWYGTSEQYNAIAEKDKDNDTIYMLSDGESSSIDAIDIAYDNSISKLFATDVQNAINELATSARKADWNVNDPEDSAYIENRTHYKTEGFGDIIPVQTRNFDWQYPLGYCHYFDPWPSDTIIEDGKEYVVFWDGSSYNITAMALGSEDEGFTTYLSDSYNFEDRSQTFVFLTQKHWEDGHLFGAVVSYVDSEAATHEFGIQGITDVIKPLDEKYLPDFVRNFAGQHAWRATYEVDGETYIAQHRAEIFNDYEKNKAIGEYSHAEGEHSIALGPDSHAEGCYTKAKGYSSHAEGSHTEASGEDSHAEGHDTTASGYYSHAEGRYTSASGRSSHAEGEHTKASGECQHAQGRYNIEDSTLAHIVGNGTQDSSSNAHTLDWDGNAWFAGDVYVGSTGGKNKDSGSKKLLKQGDVITNLVNGSRQNSIRQTGAMAESRTYTLGENAVAFGLNTQASGSTAFASGVNSIASGDNSYAEGANNTASGNNSHAEGAENTASGSKSHVEGSYNNATGSNSHAEGTGTTASGGYSHSEGYSTKAEGSYSHAEGNNSTASGDGSHAEGVYSTAIGRSSHAEGLYSITEGEGSHVEGYYTKALGTYQHTQGKYNIPDTTSAHIVGNGTSDSVRSNAHTLDWDGNAWFAGNVYIDSTSGINKDEGSKKLVTVDEMNAAIAAAIEAAFANIARAENTSF